MNILEQIRYLYEKGGVTMAPLLFLAILALSTIFERLWFWVFVLTKEKEAIEHILEAAREQWHSAGEIARRASNQPVGRFLYSALRLPSPDPELFRLALEASADDELAAMRRGDKTLEAIIALSPLLGLLGTVLGLIKSLGEIRLGDIGTAAAEGVTFGIGEALISTAVGLIVAIIALAFYRLFQSFLAGQVKLFRRAGNELELMYRQNWLVRDELTVAVEKPVARSLSFEKNKPEKKMKASERTDSTDYEGKEP